MCEAQNKAWTYPEVGLARRERQKREWGGKKNAFDHGYRCVHVYVYNSWVRCTYG